MKTLFLLLSLALPPCATEDSTNCHWDAQTRGNGQGVSFVDLGGMLIREGYDCTWSRSQEETDACVAYANAHH